MIHTKKTWAGILLEYLLTVTFGIETEHCGHILTSDRQSRTGAEQGDKIYG